MFEKLRITQKRKAIVHYFRIVSAVDKSRGNLSELPDDIKDYGDGLFSNQEYNKLTANKNRAEEIEFNKWSDVLSILLSMDLTARCYYYKIFSLIMSSIVSKEVKDYSKDIEEQVYYFYVYSFLTSLLDKVFDEKIKPECLTFIPLISALEDGDVFDIKNNSKFRKIPLCNIYLLRKDEIIEEGKYVFKETLEIIREYQYFSESIVERYIDETDRFFETDLGLLDFDLPSDTIGLKRKAKEV